MAHHSRLLSEHEEREDSSQTEMILSKSESEYLPLSYGQEQLWFLDKMGAGSTQNIVTTIELVGPLDQVLLERSLNDIIRRYEILRATFTTVDGHPKQMIAPILTLELPLVDLRHFPDTEQENETQRVTTKVTRQAFDLAKGPLIRPLLLRLGEKKSLLLLVMHQIICDIYSLSVVIQEVVNLYEAFVSGRSSSLPAPSRQYKDFVRWEQAWLESDAVERELAYWKQQLDGRFPYLQLPTDGPRQATPRFQDEAQSFALSKSLSEALRVLSQREGVTLFVTMLAAFQTLLHRYTEQNDVVVGSSINNREHSEVEGLIGFFLNTLAVRTNLAGNPTFRGLLSRVQEGVSGAFAHHQLPFIKLLEVLQPERNLGHNPLFQIMFMFQDAPFPTQETPDLTFTPSDVHAGMAGYDLTLLIIDTGQELKGTLIYNTDLFNASTINRLVGHLKTLLESVVANSNQRLSELTLLTEAERHQLLFEWSPEKIDYPQEKCYHQLFEAQARLTPTTTAVIFEDKELTYKALNERANRLAHHLLAMGVSKGTTIGVCTEFSLEVVEMILGLFKTGGIFIPLDPTYPEEYLKYIIADAKPAAILTHSRYLKALPENGPEILCLDTMEDILIKESDENPDIEATGEDLCAVFYTSGSTGQPKGVMVSHQAHTVRSFYVEDICQLSTENHHLLKSPLNVGPFVGEMFWPLITGGQLTIIRPGGEKDSAYLNKLCLDRRINVMNFVPSEMQMLLNEKHLTVDRYLKHGFCSGDVLTVELQQRFAALLSAHLHKFYGSTEGSAITYCKYDENQPLSFIGRPAYMKVYLLDSHLQPVPIGVPGEICVSGIGLAQGYLNQPELTAEKFIPNPFSDESGERLFRTGDLGRFLPDGSLEFFGRIDHQVKIRGFRIELGEIEAMLRQHPVVHEAVVVAQEDEGREKRLVSYIVPQPGEAPTINSLRDFLKQKLPAYMIPSIFITLDQLPLTPNGKLDRRALPRPDQKRPELERVFVPPRTATEKILTELWAEILGLEQVGIYDDFFDLGGHSLLATQVMSRLHQSLQVELPLRSLFETLTVANLAHYIETIRQAAQGSQTPHKTRRDDRQEIVI